MENHQDQGRVAQEARAQLKLLKARRRKPTAANKVLSTSPRTPATLIPRYRDQSNRERLSPREVNERVEEDHEEGRPQVNTARFSYATKKSGLKQPNSLATRQVPVKAGVNRTAGREEEATLQVVAPVRTSHTNGDVKLKPTIVWSCSTCEKECIPVRDQSRCMCGHRLKDHPPKEMPGGGVAFQCCSGKCSCSKFTFIVAEGAWILRCSCKHKHTDHDPRTHACSKASCSCAKFFSPWVCNCDHPWSDHVQRIEYRRVKTIEDMMRELAVGGDDVKRTDLLAEPLRL